MLIKDKSHAPAQLSLITPSVACASVPRRARICQKLHADRRAPETNRPRASAPQQSPFHTTQISEPLSHTDSTAQKYIITKFWKLSAMNIKHSHTPHNISAIWLSVRKPVMRFWDKTENVIQSGLKHDIAMEKSKFDRFLPQQYLTELSQNYHMRRIIYKTSNRWEYSHQSSEKAPRRNIHTPARFHNTVFKGRHLANTKYISTMDSFSQHSSHLVILLQFTRSVILHDFIQTRAIQLPGMFP